MRAHKTTGTTTNESSRGRAGGSKPRHRPRWHAGRRWADVLPALFPDRKLRADCRCRHPHQEFGDGADEILLDVRGLPMHAQIGRTLERMEALGTGQRLRHVSEEVLWPMLAMLETRGYRYRLLAADPGEVHVVAWNLATGQSKEAPSTG